MIVYILIQRETPLLDQPQRAGRCDGFAYRTSLKQRARRYGNGSAGLRNAIGPRLSYLEIIDDREAEAGRAVECHQFLYGQRLRRPTLAA
jgi:hypothetical protein